MAGVKISALPAVASALLTDFCAVVQGGVTSRETLQQILTLFNSNIQITEAQVTNLVADLASKLDLAGGTMLGDLILNADPTLPLQAATKEYVDVVAQGFTIIGACRVATTAPLTVTYNNVSAPPSGVGATLTNAGAMAALSIDGVALSVGNRVLVKDQAAPLQNGVYSVTDIGSGATNWVMTRTTDFDQPSEIQPGDLVVINEGTANTQTSWLQTATVVSVGVDSILFSQFSANPSTFLRIANNLSELSGTAATARGNISAAQSGANADITSLTGLTGTIQAPTGITDSNGDVILDFSYAVLPVNFIEITNAQTANGPQINANGDDATVPLNIGVKESFLALYNTTGVNTAPQLRFYDADFTHYTGFKVADAATNSVDFQWPSLDGRSGEALITNGLGVFSFGSGSAQPNVIIAGNFDTNPWQRGTSFVATPTGTAIADGFRWSIAGAGGGVVTITQTGDAPTPQEAGFIVSSCLHVDVTTADVAIGAADSYFLRYVIEGYDFARIAQQDFTISFWVKSTITGEYGIGLTNSGGDQRYVGTYTVDVADTWEFKTVIIDASPAAGTWNYTDGSGLFVFFTLATGSTFQTTAGIWQNTTFVNGTVNQVNAMSSTANNFKLALVKIEPGSVATPYPLEFRPDVLARCQRYFYKTFAQGVTPAQNIGSNVGALAYRAWIAGVASGGAILTFPVTMRAAPAFTFYSPSAASANWYNATAAAQSGVAATTSALGQNQAYITSTQVAGDTVNAFIVLHLTADASL